jgi:hypothetical protein
VGCLNTPGGHYEIQVPWYKKLYPWHDIQSLIASPLQTKQVGWQTKHLKLMSLLVEGKGQFETQELGAPPKFM